MQNKMIIIRQNDIKDCGACSLQSIILYYQGYVSLEKIREDTFTNYEGTTVYHLKKAAEKYGFDAIAKKYLDKKLPLLKLPCIVHVHYENGLNHFMCLYKINKNKMILMDPAKGRIQMDINEFNKIFTGVIIELYPKSQIVVMEKHNNISTLFLNLLKINKDLCIRISINSLLLTITTILSGLYFKVRYELMSNNQDLAFVKITIYLFLVITIYKIIFDFRKSYYENHLNKNIDVRIYKEFITHIFNLPLKVFENRTTGEIVTRISELNSIKDLFTQIFLSGVLDGSLLLFTLVILLIINIRLTLLLCLIIIIYIIISLLVNPYLYKRIKQNIDFQTNLNSELIENINMIESIKNLNKVKISNLKIEKCSCDLLFDNYDFFEKINYITMIKNLILEIGIFIINTIGFYMIDISKMTIIDLIVFNTLFYYLIDPIKNIMNLLLKFNFLKASFNKITDFIDIEEEKEGELETFKNGDICFKEVGFSYNDYSKIIDNFSVTINNGSKVFLTGKSGSGKSTLCSMITKKNIPTTGSITINGKDIRDYSLRTLRNNIIYVGQHEQLYSDTIKNNILFYEKNNKMYEKICKICFVDKIINKKAMRADFGVDNSASNISGGEKQRIILARALLLNRNIIILDEALSEVDYHMEKMIIKNILKEFSDKTIIYTSHKNHGKLFNKIITLENIKNEE